MILKATKKKNLLVITYIAIGILVLGVVAGYLALSTGWKTYTSNSLFFEYPRNWKANICQKEGPIFILPKLSSAHKDFTIVGGTIEDAIECSSYGLVVDQKEVECRGEETRQETQEELSNGLTMDLISREESRVSRINIQGNNCLSSLVFGFKIYEITSDKTISDSAGMDKGELLNSSQYKDIVKFAESIEIKE